MAIAPGDRIVQRFQRGRGAAQQQRDAEHDLDQDQELLAKVLDRVQDLENEGYQFEAAEASFILLVEKLAGRRHEAFESRGFRVSVAGDGENDALTEATVKLRAGGARVLAVGEGNGPVNALDHALREAIGQAYPGVAKFELIDYKVRILDEGHGTDAVTRVLIETSDGESSWVTVGVGANVIEASWGALLDGVVFGLRRHGETPISG